MKRVKFRVSRHFGRALWFPLLWWPFGWNWSYFAFLGIIWRKCGSKCRGEGEGIFLTLCVEFCLVFIMLWLTIFIHSWCSGILCNIFISVMYHLHPIFVVSCTNTSVWHSSVRRHSIPIDTWGYFATNICHWENTGRNNLGNYIWPPAMVMGSGCVPGLSPGVSVIWIGV